MVMPESVKDHSVKVGVPLNMLRNQFGEELKVKEGQADQYDHIFLNLNTKTLLNATELWYDRGVEEGIPEEDLRYLKPQATEFKALIGMNCYSDDTEVLTEDGWKLFKNATLNDNFYSINPKTNECEIVKAKAKIKKKYKGDMIRCKGQSIDLLTTPEHQNYVSYSQKHKSENFKLDKAKNGLKKKHVAFKKNCNPISGKKEKYITLEGKNNNQLKMEVIDFMTLLGFYISDGSLLSSKSHKIVQISKGNKKVLKKYEKIFKKYNLNPYYTKTNYGVNVLSVHSHCLYNYLKPLGNSIEKYIPKDLFKYDHSILSKLWDGLVEGDGHIEDNGHISYSTSSKKLKNNIQRLLLHLGISGTVNEIDRIGEVSKGVAKNGKKYNIETKNISYNISVNKNKNEPAIKRYNGKIDKDKIKKSKYDGYVYCFELEKNHTLFVRRNGKVQWSGNCHSLRDWFRIRCCKNAQTEIRDLAMKMLNLCKDAAPDLFEDAGPNCIRLGYCPENNLQHEDCKDKIPTKDQALKIIKDNYKEKIFKCNDCGLTHTGDIKDGEDCSVNNCDGTLDYVETRTYSF